MDEQFIDPMMQEFDFAQRQREMTPEQMGQFYAAQGLPAPEIPQAMASEPMVAPEASGYVPRYDLNMPMMFGAAQQPQQQQAPPPPDPNLFYGGLQRGPDGRLQGIGPGTDEQTIRQRALQQAPFGSDLYQQREAINPAGGQGASLEQMFAQVQLTSAEQMQLAQSQSAMARITSELAAHQITPREASMLMAANEQTMAPLMRKQSMAADLAQQIEVKKRMQAATELKMLEIQGRNMDAKTFWDRVTTDPMTGVRGYLDKNNSFVPLPGPDGAKGGAANKVVPFDSTLQLKEAEAEARVELAKSGGLYLEDGKENMPAVMKRAAERFEERRAHHEAGMKANAERVARVMPAAPQGQQQQGPPPGFGVNIPEGWTPKAPEPPLPTSATKAQEELETMKKVYGNIANATPEMQRRAAELRRILNQGR